MRRLHRDNEVSGRTFAPVKRSHLTMGYAVKRCRAGSSPLLGRNGRPMIENLRRAQRVSWLALVVSLAAIGGAAAQSYPTHPIRWIIGFPPGGPTDILVRIMGDWLSTRLGQPVVVENKAGAASNIATEAVINAAADGYTIAS